MYTNYLLFYFLLYRWERLLYLIYLNSYCFLILFYKRFRYLKGFLSTNTSFLITITTTNTRVTVEHCDCFYSGFLVFFVLFVFLFVFVYFCFVFFFVDSHFDDSKVSNITYFICCFFRIFFYVFSFFYFWMLEWNFF